MEVLIREDYESLSLAAADIIAHVVRRQPHAVLGLPTGATPLATYRKLIRMHVEEGLDFSQVTTFNL